MRRYVALALLLLFVGQSSGAALAGTTNSTEGGVNLLVALVDPLRAAIVSSRVYALATGTESRYEATHARRPQIVKRTTDLDAARIIQALHPLHPQIRLGIRREFTMPPRSELDAHHHRRDPLAMRRSARQPGNPTSAPGGFLEPLRSLTLPQNTARNGAIGLQHRGGIKPLTSSTQGTGIEHWWTYEERAVPGVGKAMVNVGTGNYIVSAMDVDVPEQGIDLTFQRVYNSQSLHDYNHDDGGDSAIFGNRWTNNFDANIVYDSTGPTITVYDLNGTACTYSSDGQGNWVPCTGEYATLVPTDSTDCTYAWTKKNGTVYWFHTDQTGAGCGIQLAKKGHLQEILARNNNNLITFTYSYYGSGYGAEDVSEIDANHSDGQELVMKFGVIPTTSINELATITRPDGSVLRYSYDTSGNLLEVDKPGNNSANTVPSGHGVPEGDVPETYAYVIATSTMQEACGPRCTAAIWNNPDNPKDGAAILFTPDGSNRLTSWQINGVLNFTPDDGTSTVLQSGPSTKFQQWYLANFVYGNGSACSNAGPSSTTMCDTDSHATVWATDASSRVTETQDFTGSNTSIATYEVWDTSNNLIQTEDANDYITKYGYDTPGYSQGGNLVEMQLPQATDFTINGQNATLSPLSYYTYDQHNNVTSYCDPVYNQSKGNSWVPPADNLCPGGGGTARFFFNGTDQNEPYGCLSSMKKPGNYSTTISYPGNPGPCGYGLPTQTTGDTITQYDNSTRTPTQDFGYDGLGNLTSYDKGKDGLGRALDSWTLGYDSENQLMQKTENDASIPLSGSSFSCYYPDGSLLYTETPSQHDADGDHNCPSTLTLLEGNYSPPVHSTAYYYDLDGDQVKVITHKGCSTNTPCPGASQWTACVTGESNPVGTTCKYYDGLDRLVETIEPYEKTREIGSQPYEFYGFRWMNRYIYDLSQLGGSASLQISDNTGTVANLVAYGNLYKTQEYLPTKKTQTLGQSVGSANWYDLRGTSFDGLDRPVGKYELAYGTSAVTLSTYDCSGQLDLLCSTKNAASQTTSYTYDTIRRVKEIDFSGTLPLADGRTYTFDPDGRTATASGDTMGTMSYTYDVDGNELSVTEPSNEHAASLICFSPYSDGMREFLSIALPSDSCSNVPSRSNPSIAGISQKNIFSYSYQTDGPLATQQVNWLSNQETFSWTYTPSERETAEKDPLTGSNGFVKKAYTYDGYGRVNSLALPEGGFVQSHPVYDDDDELAGYQASAGSETATRQFTLNARGELLQDVTQDITQNQQFTTYAQGPTYSANGTQVGNGDCRCGGNIGTITAPPTTLQFDVRSGMATCSPNTQWPTLTTDENYTYDVAGRQTGAGPSQTGGCDNNPTSSASYDAENHIQQTTVSWEINNSPGGTCSQANVTWGPDGRQRVDRLSGCTGGDQSQTAHWDGDTMLFSTEGTANAVLYIGKLAVMDQTGQIVVGDRDQTGAQASTHGYAAGTTFYTAWATGSPRTSLIAKNGGSVSAVLFPGTCGGYSQSACPAVAAAYGMLRSDGYAMVGGLVQGVRTYDPTSGQWLTPDPYAGDVRHPISQKPFMWNGNNPVEYSDPTGFYTFAEGTPPEQEREFSYFAARLDKQVSEKLSDKAVSPTERQALEQLHTDLQPGKGSWVVGFGPTHPGSNAESVPNLTANGRFGVPAVTSTFNTKVLNTEASSEYVKAIATEGGTYEITSGRMGSELQAQALHIYKTQASGPLGDLTNRYFTEPLGLGRDTMPSVPLPPP